LIALLGNGSLRAGTVRRRSTRKAPLIPCTIREGQETEVVVIETMDVFLKIPTYAYSLLCHNGVDIELRNASVENERDIDSRAKQWVRDHIVGRNTRVLAGKKLALQMSDLGLTMDVRVRIPKAKWPLYLALTERLEISMGEYLLGCVGYAVWHLERTVQTLGMEGGASK
jgi:hypothetical protein